MKSISLFLAILFCAIVVHAQRQPSAEVKVFLGSAQVHQRDNNYSDYLMIAVSIAKEKRDVYGEAVVNQRLGNYYYSRMPQKSMEYQYLAFDGYMHTGDTAMAAICLHNIGFVYEEQMNNIPNAIWFINEAINLHRQLKDTMELANMYKYMGMLKGKLREYGEAKQFVRKAIKYYRIKNYEPGVAVSYFDMAKVYAEQHMSDSAIYYAEKSKQYWSTNNGRSRMFGINNELLQWYLLAGNENEAHNMLLENELMIADKSIYWKDKLNYYMNGYHYYNNRKSLALAEEYLKKYSMLRESLKSKGIKTE